MNSSSTSYTTETARTENNKNFDSVRTSRWQNFYCFMSNSSRESMKKVEREKRSVLPNTQISNFNSRHNQSSFHYGDSVYFALFSLLFCFSSRKETGKKQPTNQLQRQSVSGEFLSIFKRSSSCFLYLLPANQQALYHNFLCDTQNKTKALAIN